MTRGWCLMGSVIVYAKVQEPKRQDIYIQMDTRSGMQMTGGNDIIIAMFAIV